MGRIKTQLVKRTGEKILKQHGEHLKTTFDENKQILARVADIPSKKLRNVIAGYVTRLKKLED